MASHKQESIQDAFERIHGGNGAIASDPSANVLYTFDVAQGQLAMAIGRHNDWVDPNGKGETIKSGQGEFVTIGRDPTVEVSVQTASGQLVTVEVSMKAMRMQGVAAVVGAVNKEIKAGLRPAGDKLRIKDMPKAGFILVINRNLIYK